MFRVARIVALLAAWLYSGLVNAGEGVFLWKSDALYDAQAQKTLLAQAKQSEFARIYWGLNADQVKHPALTEARLGPLIDQLRKQGTESWLLLGEPTWILPENRPDLIRLLKRLESMPFVGVMLDLEVEQLGFPVPQRRLNDWIETLTVSVSATQKPVEITAHWRWFSVAKNPSIPGLLGSTGIKGATLMIYSTNIDSVLRIAENSTLANGMRMRVAQSIEPFLTSTESWAHRTRIEQQQGWRRLRQSLHAPIDWQAYEYIQPMD